MPYMGEDALAEARFALGRVLYRACRSHDAEPFVRAVAEHHIHHRRNLDGFHLWQEIHMEWAQRGLPHELGFVFDRLRAVRCNLEPYVMVGVSHGDLCAGHRTPESERALRSGPLREFFRDRPPR